MASRFELFALFLLSLMLAPIFTVIIYGIFGLICLLGWLVSLGEQPGKKGALGGEEIEW